MDDLEKVQKSCNNIIRFKDDNPLIENGVLLRNNASKTEIAKNNISGFGIGIKIERRCLDNKIYKNNIFNNSNAVISYGDASYISKNELFNNRWWGIIIQEGKDSKVTLNKIQGIMQEDSGIMIYSSSENAEISQNEIKENGLYGIYLVNTKDCIVTKNNLINCDIFVFKHLNTIFRKNTIINNYYNNKATNILGWQKIPGKMQIIAYFESTWEISWKTYDKNPASAPL
jgi:parallel beta-helix repeat protein